MSEDYPPRHVLAEQVNDRARSLMHRADDYLRRPSADVSGESRRLAEALELVERALACLEPSEGS